MNFSLWGYERTWKKLLIPRDFFLSSDDQSQPTTIPLTKTKTSDSTHFCHNFMGDFFSPTYWGPNDVNYTFFFRCPPPKFVPAFFGTTFPDESRIADLFGTCEPHGGQWTDGGRLANAPPPPADWIRESPLKLTEKIRLTIGGGNSSIFYFHPYLGKKIQIWLIFLKWLETTNQLKSEAQAIFHNQL